MWLALRRRVELRGITSEKRINDFLFLEQNYSAKLIRTGEVQKHPPFWIEVKKNI